MKAYPTRGKRITKNFFVKYEEGEPAIARSARGWRSRELAGPVTKDGRKRADAFLRDFSKPAVKVENQTKD